VWILFLEDDGTVKSHQKITEGQGGFADSLDIWDEFGVSVAYLDDLDGDQVGDIAVGARLDDDGGENRGAVWVLFLNADGTVKAQQKISNTEGGFTGELDDGDWFGTSLAWLGDIDSSGTGELAVGAKRDDDGGPDRGAVWVLSLDSDGTVQTHWKISGTKGGFTGVLNDGDRFGEGSALLGDLDGDGMDDLAVAAMRDDDGGFDRGAVWVLFLNGNSVKSHQKISDTEGGFTGVLHDEDYFGTDVDWLSGLNCDGSGVLAVGAIGDDGWGHDRGAVWLLPLNSDGTVNTYRKIGDGQGGFAGALDDEDSFGVGVASLGDLDSDGVEDLTVGAFRDDDGGYDRGAVWVVLLSEYECYVHPTNVDFDSVQVGNYRDESFTMMNTGCATIVGTISESCAEYSIVSGGGPYVLAPGDSLFVTVRFEPTTQGVYPCVVNTDSSACSDVSLIGVGFEPPAPMINAITDVENDQGRKVRINFSRSSLDRLSSPAPILQYEAFRRIDPLTSSGGTEIGTDGKNTDMISDRSTLLEGWEFVGSIPAHVEMEYNMIAPTLADSTIANGVHWSVFFIRAATAEPGIYFDSLPDSGYSIDNLEPAAPQNLEYTEPGLLTWDEATELDFNYFSVYGSASRVFDDQAELIDHTTNTTMDVQSESYSFYYVTATDFSGNEGEAATVINVVGVTDEPQKYVLGIGAYPNPFNPETTIRYSIPGAGSVVLRIYDAKGRMVKTLVSEDKSAGVYSAVWRGRDQNGTSVSTGVYFAKLEAAGQVRSIKIVLLK
jgi:hypothetical protein